MLPIKVPFIELNSASHLSRPCRRYPAQILFRWPHPQLFRAVPIDEAHLDEAHQPL